jgi:hypothetical protein
VFILSEVLEEKREERKSNAGGNLIYTVLKMRFSFCAEDGSSVQSSVSGEAMDSGDKATNKAMSTALKYALMQTFLIPTDELKAYNTENETHEAAPKEEKQKQAREQLAALPANVREGFQILGWKAPQIWSFCETAKWDNDAIMAAINLELDKQA